MAGLINIYGKCDFGYPAPRSMPLPCTAKGPRSKANRETDSDADIHRLDELNQLRRLGAGDAGADPGYRIVSADPPARNAIPAHRHRVPDDLARQAGRRDATRRSHSLRRADDLPLGHDR